MLVVIQLLHTSHFGMDYCDRQCVRELSDSVLEGVGDSVWELLDEVSDCELEGVGDSEL